MFYKCALLTFLLASFQVAVYAQVSETFLCGRKDFPWPHATGLCPKSGDGWTIWWGPLKVPGHEKGYLLFVQMTEEATRVLLGLRFECSK
jgi:hypothetical protein